MNLFGFYKWKKLNHGDREESSSGTSLRIFTFKELSEATNGFSPKVLIREGKFNGIYKGLLRSTSEVLAIKLCRNNFGNKDIMVELTMLSRLHHPNVINLIGYCFQGDQQLLVYEYMPLWSLEDYLFDVLKEPLGWTMRMKIALGTAKGLECLLKSSPPVIHRCLYAGNILLGEDFHPKLFSFDAAMFAPVDDESAKLTNVIGTFGYSDPEYFITGSPTVRSDIYGLGMVLLELITGQKVFDAQASVQAQASLRQTVLENMKDRSKYGELADPRLRGHFPLDGFYVTLHLAVHLTAFESTFRPSIEDVVTLLSYLASQEYEPASESSIA